MAYCNGPDRNDITEYYVCGTCGNGIQRCFKWDKWRNPKKDVNSFLPLTTPSADSLTQYLNREFGTQLIATEDHILCNVTDWRQITGLLFFNPVTKISLLEHGLLGHIAEIPLCADESWDLASRRKINSPEEVKKAVVDLLKAHKEKGEE
jgi:hypothetical protein